jgi:hypothetical protein
LRPETQFSPGHLELLLSVAVENDLEFVYGQAIAEVGGRRVPLGSWPPNADGVLTIGSELFSRWLTEMVRFDPDAWRDGHSAGWAFWRSLLAAGVRIAFRRGRGGIPPGHGRHGLAR